MNKFTYASLFAGIGGFELGLNKFNGDCVFASEYDPKAKTQFNQMAYEKVFGYKPEGDISKIDENDIPDHDLLVGGFPCQAFSAAGKRKGFEDSRGTLFFEIERIAKEKQPKALFLENVKGLVNHDKGNTLNIMVQKLCEIGYTVDFTILNSKYFGVPQTRERVYIIAIKDNLIKQEPWSTEGNTVVPKGKKRIQELEGIKTFNFDWPKQEKVLTRLRDVLEDVVDEKYYLNKEKTAKLIARLEEKDKEETPSILHNIYGGFKEKKPRVFKDVSPTIRTSAGGGHLPSLLEKGRAACEERADEGLRFFQDDVVGTLRTIDSCGDKRVLEVENVRGCSTRTRSYVGQPEQLKIRNDCLSNTVTSVSKDVVAFEPTYRIRKLTPLECFRLQGFSDEVFNKLKSSGISDSQLYKMAGNAVTVNVVEAIGEKLIPYLNTH